MYILKRNAISNPFIIIYATMLDKVACCLLYYFICLYGKISIVAYFYATVKISVGGQESDFMPPNGGVRQGTKPNPLGIGPYCS